MGRRLDDTQLTAGRLLSRALSTGQCLSPNLPSDSGAESAGFRSRTFLRFTDLETGQEVSRPIRLFACRGRRVGKIS
jgi:hypothetical protein